MADDGGLGEILKAFNDLPDEIVKEVRPAIEKGADEMVARMKYLAPEADGDLQASIRKEPGPHQLAVTVTAGGPLTTKPVRNSEKGNAPEFDYSLAQEYGTADHPAQPFFWPTVNTTKKRVRRRIDRAIRKAIDKVWK